MTSDVFQFIMKTWPMMNSFWWCSECFAARSPQTMTSLSSIKCVYISVLHLFWIISVLSKYLLFSEMLKLLWMWNNDKFVIMIQKYRHRCACHIKCHVKIMSVVFYNYVVFILVRMKSGSVQDDLTSLSNVLLRLARKRMRARVCVCVCA